MELPLCADIADLLAGPDGLNHSAGPSSPETGTGRLEEQYGAIEPAGRGRGLMRRSLVSIAAAVILTGSPALAVAAVGTTGSAAVEVAAEQRWAAAPRAQLTTGQVLRAGEQLRSENGQFRLSMRRDGNLALYMWTNRVLWSTGTTGHNGAKLRMRHNGNLVLLGPGGRALWTSQTPSSGAERVVMQTDGNLVMYDGGQARWATNTVVTSLAPLDTLRAGQSVSSGNGQYRLVMQTDGNLVLYAWTGRALWASDTAGNRGAWASNQSDGNLVVYSAGGRPLWASDTGDRGGSTLVVQGDGNLVLYKPGGVSTWASGSVNDRLAPGERLNRGQLFYARGTAYRFVMQGDGNLVLYTPTGAPIWSSRTAGNPGAWAIMQADGNLVVYTPDGRPLWASDTGNRGASNMYVQHDGNTVIYNAAGQPTWATRTVSPPPQSDRVTKAVNWARSQVGVSHTGETPDGMWSGWCELLVEVAYGTRNRYPSAYANYLAQRNTGRIRTDSNPPAGVLVFYDYWSSDGTTRYGHVGVSIGGGQVISTQGYSAPLPVRQHAVTGIGLPYLGWAPAPDGWPGR